ncbi:hypothetical protein PR048_006409 [Dryococelus australis]|uniref:Uncharacterized protein n=1 Tax=Dryococelus australis TaxID=614101 RepID=A0ABQ9IAW5_9NEOP|nr:hypothetical protein PR048_006409 [Dryococelus australis]
MPLLGEKIISPQQAAVIFPLKLVSHRWLENVPVAEEGFGDGKITKPTCKSFSVVRKHILRELTPLKLKVFISVAKLLQPFLTAYQTSKPTLSYLTVALKLTNSSVQKLVHFVFKGIKNQCNIMDVDLGYAAVKEQCQNLWKGVELLLFLNHGQATAEQSVSITKQRPICDFLGDIGGVKELKNLRNLCCKCTLYIHFVLRRAKTGCQNCSKERKRSEWGRNREFEIEKDIASLTQLADELAHKAEDHGGYDIDSLIKCSSPDSKRKNCPSGQLKKSVASLECP